MKRFLSLSLAVLVVLPLVIFTGCAAPSKCIFKISDKEYTLALPESTEIQYMDGNITVTFKEESVKKVDLTPLSDVPEFIMLNVKQNEGIKTSVQELILPAAVKNVCIELNSVEKLDGTQASNMEQMSVHCPIKQANLSEALKSIEIGVAMDLSAFADCPSLENVAIYHPTDLSALADFKALNTLIISKAMEEDAEWDFAPIKTLKFKTLRLFGSFFTSEEIKTLEGASFTTLQLSDEGISDLSVLKELPNLKTLLLDVSGEQPDEVLTVIRSHEPFSKEVIELLNTTIPVQQLVEYIEQGGTVYLFEEMNR